MRPDGYKFHTGCPDCGDDLVHQQNGRSTPSETTALGECPTCGGRWLVRVQMLRASNPPGERRLAQARKRLAEDRFG